MFDEQQTAAWLYHAAHLAERCPACGMVHNVQVVTTVSMLLSSNGIDSAEPSMNVVGIDDAVAVRLAIAMSCGDGSNPKISRTAAR